MTKGYGGAACYMYTVGAEVVPRVVRGVYRVGTGGGTQGGRNCTGLAVQVLGYPGLAVPVLGYPGLGCTGLRLPG